MNKQVYRMYIRSDAWKRKRRQALRHYGAVCSDCGHAKSNLHVHHVSYSSFGDELMEHLQVLCEDCHRSLHGMKPLKKRRRKKKNRKTTWLDLYDANQPADRERMKKIGLI